MKTKLIIFILLIGSINYSQSYLDYEGIPKDSSYTVYGYYQKELKYFPSIKIAQKNVNENVREKFNLVYISI